MSSDDIFHNDEQSRDDNPYRDDEPRYSDDSPPRRQKSNSTKIIIIVLAVFGFCALACCGVGTYFMFDAAQRMQDSMSNDPEVVERVQGDILEMEIPDDFTPNASMDVEVPFVKGGPSFKMAVYSSGNSGVLMMMEITAANAQMRQQQQDQLTKQILKDQQASGEAMESGEHVVTIRGQEVKFTIVKMQHPETGHAVRQVSGQFIEKETMTMLILQVAEKDYDEETVKQMLDSIR